MWFKKRVRMHQIVVFSTKKYEKFSVTKYKSENFPLPRPSPNGEGYVGRGDPSHSKILGTPLIMCYLIFGINWIILKT